MNFDEDQLSRDAFLGGRINILQPREGYRAATDPVFLAAAVCAEPGATVLELGCGVGTALLCLAARQPELVLHGVELQSDYADLANRNAQENDISISLYRANIADLPSEVKSQRFDEVLINPPFYEDEKTTAPADTGRATSHREGELSISHWIDIALRRVAPKGHFTLIHRAERLDDILSAMQGRVGDIRIKPLSARVGREAGRVVVRARKDAHGPLKLLPPLIIHQGERHEYDGDDYTDAAREILRDGKPLNL